VAGPASLRGGMEKTQEAALRSIAYSISSARGLRRRVTLDRMARYTDAAKKIYKLARWIAASWPAWPSHPRPFAAAKTWMRGTSPGTTMTTVIQRNEKCA